jgi:hypothetical protein
MDNTHTCTITINDEPVKLLFGSIAGSILVDVVKNQPELVENDFVDEAGCSWILYAGYINQCKVKNITPTYKRSDFVVFLEDAQLTVEGENTLSMIGKTVLGSPYIELSKIPYNGN